MHQKGYNEALHIMEVWLLSWKKHWFVCPAHGGFVSGICNLKSCWCWFVAILKCRPWERGLHMQTCIWVTLAWSNWYWITCRKASESFFGGKLVFQLFFLYLECLFSLRHPNFFENSERLKSDTLESFMATNRHIFFLFVFYFKFLTTILKFSATEAMSGTSSHFYSNGYFCVLQEARNMNQMILVLKKEHTLSHCTSFRGNYHLSLLQKVLQW